MISAWLGRLMSGSTARGAAAPGDENSYRRPDGVIALGSRIAGILAAMLLIWAVAAGTWRAILTLEVGLPVQRVPEGAWMLQAAGELTAPSWTLIGGAVLYAAGALGATALILLAAGVIGGAFGFLFGLPRMGVGQGPTQVTQNIQTGRDSKLVSDATLASQPAPPRPDPGAADRAAADAAAPAAPQSAQTATRAARAGDGVGPGFRMSPALTEIADWLTKIIVGLGLVQARDIGAGFRDVMFWLLGPAGLERFPAAGVVVPACMMIGLIGGFILIYLIMTLVVGPELAEAAYDLDTPRVRQEKEEKEEAQRRAREAERLRLEAEGNERALLARQRAALINIWRSVELTSLAVAQANVQSPPITPAARQFADLEIGDLSTLEEKETWAKINVARSREDPKYESRAKTAVRAYLDATKEGGT